jgi:hypothetical protein
MCVCMCVCVWKGGWSWWVERCREFSCARGPSRLAPTPTHVVWVHPQRREEPLRRARAAVARQQHFPPQVRQCGHNVEARAVAQRHRLARRRGRKGHAAQRAGLARAAPQSAAARCLHAQRCVAVLQRHGVHHTPHGAAAAGGGGDALVVATRRRPGRGGRRQAGQRRGKKRRGRGRPVSGRRRGARAKRGGARSARSATAAAAPRGRALWRRAARRVRNRGAHRGAHRRGHATQRRAQRGQPTPLHGALQQLQALAPAAQPAQALRTQVNVAQHVATHRRGGLWRRRRRRRRRRGRRR